MIMFFGRPPRVSYRWLAAATVVAIAFALSAAAKLWMGERRDGMPHDDEFDLRPCTIPAGRRIETTTCARP
jgi:hypothetical protein